MSLKKYKAKRKFDKTPEPKGRLPRGVHTELAERARNDRSALKFMIHKHDASRLHYDLRLELDGVLKSWAVPKGPSLNPKDKHLAVHVEDHPYDYKDFEGVIPEGEYGAGPSMIWDRGTYSALPAKISSKFSAGERAGRKTMEGLIRAGLKSGHMTFILNGKKLKGEFTLIRFKRGGDKAWLLIKKGDEFASEEDVLKKDKSVKSGKTIEQLK